MEINPSEYKILIVDDVMSNVLLLKVLLTNEKLSNVRHHHASNTKSGFSLSTCSNACRPLLAVAIANFSFVKSTFNNNTLDITSSTMRILYSEGLISIFILYNIVFPFIYIIYLRYSLKYSTIRFKPSSSSMAGFQFSFSFASVISG